MNTEIKTVKNITLTSIIFTIIMYGLCWYLNKQSIIEDWIAIFAISSAMFWGGQMMGFRTYLIERTEEIKKSNQSIDV